MTEQAEGAQKRCFVIGPIGTPGSDTRDRADTLLEYIIKPAVEPLGYDVFRADEVDDPGTITDRIITDTLDADLVVADLTDHNPNAFYELGIRHNEGKATIHLIADGQAAPFDLSDQRHVSYNLNNPQAHKAAQDKLRAMVEATQAEGFQPHNPVTRARGRASLNRSEDSMEQLIAGLIERQDRVERQLHASEVRHALSVKDRLKMRTDLGLGMGLRYGYGIPTDMIGDTIVPRTGLLGIPEPGNPEDDQ